MALIKCPECHQEVSDKAKTCPHCGNPMKKVSLPDLSNLKKKPSKNFIIVGLVIAAVIVAVFGFTLLRNRDPYDRLAKRVEEIQKDPALADADQIQSDIELMNEVSRKWGDESNKVIDNIISIWEDANRENAGAESKNKAFTNEYVKGGLNSYVPIQRYMNSEDYNNYQSTSETIDSNMTVLNQYKNDSVSQSNYVSQDLVDRSDYSSWFFVASEQLYKIASKEVGTNIAYANYTPNYSTENGTTYLYPEFIAEDRNNIELDDYCATANSIRDRWKYFDKTANE